jgi:apolipoprotein D and lipocalin family protein
MRTQSLLQSDMQPFGSFVLLCILIFSGCMGVPPGVQVVEDFEIERYQGAWYEIARLDHRFEKGLTHVSATYTPRADGGVTVNNRGYDSKRNRWKSIEGRAYAAEAADKGRLKVSFFRPFYAAYNVIALDQKDYSFAMVCGANKSYLWILSREKILPDSVFNKLVSDASRVGFPTQDLVLVPQDNALLSSSNSVSKTKTHNEKGEL